MKYERLTPKILLSDVLKEYGICCVGEPTIGTFGGHDIAKLIDRLVEIEDKIESGEIDYVADKDAEIARLTAENQRLREEAAEQKSIAEYEHAMQMEWFKITCDYKAENAELRKTFSKMETVKKELTDRIKNAVELPCVQSVKTKEWIDKVEIGDTIWEWAVVYIDRQGEFVVEPCMSRYAAEARLKEMKENNND